MATSRRQTSNAIMDRGPRRRSLRRGPPVDHQATPSIVGAGCGVSPSTQKGIGNTLPIQLTSRRQGVVTKACVESAVIDQTPETGSQSRGTVVGDHDAGAEGPYGLLRAAAVEHHGRHARCMGLQDHIAERVGEGREGESIRRGIGSRQLVTSERAREDYPPVRPTPLELWRSGPSPTTASSTVGRWRRSSSNASSSVSTFFSLPSRPT